MLTESLYLSVLSKFRSLVSLKPRIINPGSKIIGISITLGLIIFFFRVKPKKLYPKFENFLPGSCAPNGE